MKIARYSMVIGCCHFCLDLADVVMHNNGTSNFWEMEEFVKEGEIVLDPDQIFL
jgi:hypothetical protein